MLRFIRFAFVALCVCTTMFWHPTRAEALTPEEEQLVNAGLLEADGLLILLDGAYPGTAALAELPASTQNAIVGNHDDSLAMIQAVQQELSEYLDGSRPLKNKERLQDLQVDLRNARDLWRVASLDMQIALYPTEDALLMPRYAVPRSALNTAIWVTPASGDLMALNYPVPLVSVHSILNEPDARLVGTLTTVPGPIFLNDFLVIEDTLTSVEGDVVLGTNMWLATGASIQLKDADLVHNPLVYQEGQNGNFSPLLYALDRQARTQTYNDLWSIFGIFPEVGDPVQLVCGYCACGCNEVCAPDAFDMGGFVTATNHFAQCPTDIQEAFGPSYELDLVQEAFAEFEQYTSMSDPILIGQWPGFVEEGLTGFFGYSPEDCGGIPTPPLGGGGACRVSCGPFCVDPIIPELQDTPTETAQPQWTGGECGDIASAVIDGGICDPTHCDMTMDGNQAVNGRWGAEGTPIDSINFLSLDCLRSMPGGELPVDCELGQPGRLDEHIAKPFCDELSGCSAPEELFDGPLLCTSTSESATCFRCNALGQCHLVDSEWSPTADEEVVNIDEDELCSCGLNPDDFSCIIATCTGGAECIAQICELEKTLPTADRAKADEKTGDANPPTADDDVDGGRKHPTPAEIIEDLLAGMWAGDPVLLLSGALVDHEVDLSMPSSFGSRLAFKRSYVSDGRFASHLGRNWAASLTDEHLVVLDENTVDYDFPQWCYLLTPIVTCVYYDYGDGTGELYMFDPGRDGLYIPQAGGTGVIRQTEAAWGGYAHATFYTHRSADGMISEFDMWGRLRRKQTASGSQLFFEYDLEDRLTRVVDERGHGFRFEYGLWDLLIAVEDTARADIAGQRVEFCYELAVRPSVGLLSNNDPLLMQDIGLTDGGGGQLVPGCYTITDALPSNEELEAIRRCAKRSTDHGAFLTCMDPAAGDPGFDPQALWDQYERPGQLDLTTNKPKRSLAFLAESRIVPADGLSSAGACPSSGDLATRYTYSTVPLSREFIFKLARSPLIAHNGLDEDELSGMGSEWGGCGYETTSGIGMTLLKRAIENEMGKLVRVEHKLSDDELVNGAPPYASSAIRCDAGCGSYWSVELESVYSWEPDQESFGRVISQRYGDDASTSESFDCPVWPPVDPELANDVYQTGLPLFFFDYYQPDTFRDLYANQDLLTSLETLAATPSLLDGQPVADFLEYTSNRDCDALSAALGPYKTDMLIWDPSDQDVVSYRNDVALARESAAREVCLVVGTTDRNGLQTWSALNVLGRPLLRLENPVTQDEFTVASRFNGDGNRLESRIQPAIGGPAIVSEFASSSPLPTARDNLLRSSEFAGPGSDNLGDFSGSLVLGPTTREVEFSYEPLTNQVLRVEDSRNGITEFVYEYQETAAGIDGAVAQMAFFKLDFWADSPAIAATGDVNGQPGDSVRPIPVAVHHPLSNGGYATEQLRYDGYGNLSQRVAPDGTTTAYTYDPAMDAWSELPTISWVPVVSVPLSPVARLATEGGAVTSIVTTEDWSLTSSAFPGARSSVTETVQFTNLGPNGLRSSTVLSDVYTGVNRVMVYQYDGHRRIEAATTIDGGMVSYGFDGANRAIASVVNGLTQTRVVRGVDGRELANCTAPISSALCDASLVSMLDSRWFGDASDALLISTIDYDGEGRPTGYTSPELRRQELTYHPWAGPASTSIVDASSTAAPVLQTDNYEYDAHGNLTGATRGELVTEYGYNGFGELVVSKDPDGLITVLWRDDPEGLVTRVIDRAADGTDVRWVDIHRDTRGNPIVQQETFATDLGSPGSYTVLATTIQRDALDRPSCVGLPSGMEVVYGYAGGQVARTDTNKVAVPCQGPVEEVLSTSVSHIDPDAHRMLTQTTSGSRKQKSQLDVDWAGRATQRIDERGANDAVYTWNYDAWGRLQQYDNVRGASTVINFDTLGRPVGSTADTAISGGGVVTTTAVLDRDGLPARVVDPELRSSHFVRDAAGRVVVSARPDVDGTDFITTTAYDNSGRAYYMTEGNNAWSYSFVGGLQPSQIATFESITGLSYDLLGNLTNATYTNAANTVTTARTHDGRGRVIQESTNIDGLTTSTVHFGFEAEGRLDSVLAYQPAGFVDDLSLTIGYDGPHRTLVAGSRVSPGGGYGPTDVYDHVTSWSGAFPTGLEVRADPAGVTGTTPVWISQVPAFDSFGRASAVEWWGGDTTSGTLLGFNEQFYARDDRQAASVHSWFPASVPDPVGSLSIPSYDGELRADGYRDAKVSGAGSAATLSSWLSTLDTNSGALWGAGINGTSSSYGGGWYSLTRKPNGMLQQESGPGGNRWTANFFAAGPGVQQIDSVLTDGQTSLTYDTQDRSQASDSRFVDWDDYNRPTTVQASRLAPDTGLQEYVQETFVHDAFGRQIRTVRDQAVTIDKVYVGWELLRESSSCGDRVYWPSGTPDQPAAYTIAWDPACDESTLGSGLYLAELYAFDMTPATVTAAMTAPGGETYGVLADIHGDVVGVVGPDGTLLEHYDYDPWGARSVFDAVTGQWVCDSTSTDACPSMVGNTLGYTGRPLSSYSGLYDMRHRQYDPHFRRFLSPDPLGYIDGFDVWQYAGGDPFNFVDPMGLGSEGAGAAKDTWNDVVDTGFSACAVFLGAACDVGKQAWDGSYERRLDTIFTLAEGAGTFAAKAKLAAEDGDEEEAILNGLLALGAGATALASALSEVEGVRGGGRTGKGTSKSGKPKETSGRRKADENSNGKATEEGSGTSAGKGEGRIVYPRGPGAASGALPKDYVEVSRWMTSKEAKLWVANGGTKIPHSVGANGRVYVTSPGAARPGGTGGVRVDFAVPSAALSKAGRSDWYQVLQTGQDVPIHNVTVHYPAGK